MNTIGVQLIQGLQEHSFILEDYWEIGIVVLRVGCNLLEADGQTGETSGITLGKPASDVQDGLNISEIA